MVVREFPQATEPLLRFQVGKMVERPMVLPVVSINKTIMAHTETSEVVEVFHLLGFGETLDDAKRMAGAR